MQDGWGPRWADWAQKQASWRPMQEGRGPRWADWAPFAILSILPLKSKMDSVLSRRRKKIEERRCRINMCHSRISELVNSLLTNKIGWQDQQRHQMCGEEQFQSRVESGRGQTEVDQLWKDVSENTIRKRFTNFHVYVFYSVNIWTGRWHLKHEIEWHFFEFKWPPIVTAKKGYFLRYARLHGETLAPCSSFHLPSKTDKFLFLCFHRLAGASKRSWAQQVQSFLLFNENTVQHHIIITVII